MPSANYPINDEFYRRIGDMERKIAAVMKNQQLVWSNSTFAKWGEAGYHIEDGTYGHWFYNVGSGNPVVKAGEIDDGTNGTAYGLAVYNASGQRVAFLGQLGNGQMAVLPLVQEFSWPGAVTTNTLSGPRAVVYGESLTILRVTAALGTTDASNALTASVYVNGGTALTTVTIPAGDSSATVTPNVTTPGTSVDLYQVEVTSYSGSAAADLEVVVEAA